MKCNHCKKGKLEVIKGYEPYNIDHYQCNYCDSTFNIEEISSYGGTADTVVSKAIVQSGRTGSNPAGSTKNLS